MIDWLEERRQVSRIPIRNGYVYLKSSWSTIQLLDISLGGVLMSASRSFPVGHRAGLRTVVNGERVAVEVEIKRDDPPTSGRQGTRLVGASFVTLDERSRQSLEKFLRQRTSEA